MHGGWCLGMVLLALRLIDALNDEHVASRHPSFFIFQLRLYILVRLVENRCRLPFKINFNASSP
jgi:hypothetical protein